MRCANFNFDFSLNLNFDVYQNLNVGVSHNLNFQIAKTCFKIPPRNWVHGRNLRCLSVSKSVSCATQAQIEERADRPWKLRDMTHLGKVNRGAPVNDGGSEDKSAVPPMRPTPVTRPTLVGKTSFSIVTFPAGLWKMSRGGTI